MTARVCYGVSCSPVILLFAINILSCRLWDSLVRSSRCVGQPYEWAFLDVVPSVIDNHPRWLVIPATVATRKRYAVGAFVRLVGNVRIARARLGLSPREKRSIDWEAGANDTDRYLHLRPYRAWRCRP